MSQQQLAQGIGLSRVSVANIESGRHRIQLHVLYAIAQILGVTLEQLLPTSRRQPTNLPHSISRELKPNERAAVEKLIAPSEDTDAS